MRATRRRPNGVLRVIVGVIVLVLLEWALLSVVTATYWFMNASV